MNSNHVIDLFDGLMEDKDETLLSLPLSYHALCFGFLFILLPTFSTSRHLVHLFFRHKTCPQTPESPPKYRRTSLGLPTRAQGRLKAVWLSVSSHRDSSYPNLACTGKLKPDVCITRNVHVSRQRRSHRRDDLNCYRLHLGGIGEVAECLISQR